MERSRKTFFSSARWPGSTSVVIKHVDSMYSEYGSDTLFLVFLPKAHNPSLIVRETSDTLQSCGTNHYPLKLALVVKNEESQRNPHSRGETKETTKCSVTSWRGTGTGKGHQVQTKKIRITYELQLKKKRRKESKLVSSESDR